MTINEVQKLADQLTDITVKFWDADSYVKKIKLQDTYTHIKNSINSAGFKIRKRWVFDSTYNRRIIRYTVKAIPSGSMFEHYNPCPTNLKIKGDCTTRCITYCTGEDYMKIRAEQLTASAKIGMTWRHIEVWSKSLESRGFKKLLMDKRMTRATFIKKYGSKITSGIIATRSSGHIAAIDMAKKKVVDSWDSTGGRILMLYVHSSQYDEVVKALHS